ncbi:MAG TPA: cysteine rich repeat-containing protein [Xanthobacteraceae bacterium]|nr:cysteine rich repeat-containing protein [Xanthobacteraceae bacterium]
MWRNASLILALVLGSSTTAMAQFEGSPQEQAACRPDVGKLCRGVQGGSPAILDCLVGHHTKLSARCRAVLETHGKIPAR